MTWTYNSAAAAAAAAAAVFVVEVGAVVLEAVGCRMVLSLLAKSTRGSIPSCKEVKFKSFK